MGKLKRQAELIFLCEDQQQSVFLYRFFKSMGWDSRKLKFELSPLGKGSAEQFVRERFPVELESYRQRRSYINCKLVVMIDGDNHGPDARLRGLQIACQQVSVEPRKNDDQVAVFVPTWCIETWFAYLDGITVDETTPNYPRLERPKECQRHVDFLKQMCLEGRLRNPSPPSLDAACQEYRTLG